MAWENRGGKRYFYRSRRVNGRVTKVYLGAGDVARQAAEKDAAVKAAQAKEEANLAALRAELADLDRITSEADRATALLLEGELLAMGYHEHKGEWRLRRG